MELEYALSDKAQQQRFKNGEDHTRIKTVQFELIDLSEDARAKWLEMFSTNHFAQLKLWRVTDGIYDDGSVSKYKPTLVQSTAWLEQDGVLTPETVSDAIAQLHTQYGEVKAEREKLKPKWEKALAEYQQKQAMEKAVEEKRKAEQQAQEQARKERLANLGWIQQLTKQLAIENERDAEIKRFSKKFQLETTDLETQEISDKPFVRLSVKIPISIGEISRTLEISNRTYHNIDGEDWWEPPEFSDLCVAIADGLAKIFKGEVKTVIDYRRGIAYLNVVASEDTINVATCELERAEW